MVDEQQTYEESFSNSVIEDDLCELESDGTVPTEASEEVVEEVLEPFPEDVSEYGDHICRN